MFGLGVRHVREMPLESSLEVRYAWLTLEKAEKPDMSDRSLRNLARGLDMSGMIGVFGCRIDF
jgi:hypothetical protein